MINPVEKDTYGAAPPTKRETRVRLEFYDTTVFTVNMADDKTQPTAALIEEDDEFLEFPSQGKPSRRIKRIHVS